jgi:hypothetical protein
MDVKKKKKDNYIFITYLPLSRLLYMYINNSCNNRERKDTITLETELFETEIPVSEMKPGELLIVRKVPDKYLQREIIRLERYRGPPPTTTS